jgi:peptidyl-dipeptidase A
MRAPYKDFVKLGNEGARELGFKDLGAMWRSSYDMDPDAFATELNRLWDQVRPLYEALHCHVRASLAKAYGTEVVPESGPIPAHVLGNMWAQEWGNVYDLVAPADQANNNIDVTEILRGRNIDEVEMVRFGERFFTSLGFKPLPTTFWERSLFTQPKDRDVVCHPSAWNIDWIHDLRIKMCIEVNSTDFSTIHHELGHNYYYRAFNRQPTLYRKSANPGFDEGIGNTLALSITPNYLVRTGLLESEPADSGDLGRLMRMALDQVAFLPFGLLVDQWRWKVFSGEVAPQHFNQAWWDLRREYQGVTAPVQRSEKDFDPGAKYHIPANVTYTRYFLAWILQFQFHRALCDEAGFDEPLYRCSIYDNKPAGAKLRAMMEMGSSRPWPDALEAVTGQRQMDAGALLEYFAPLGEWLEEQNRDRTCGW